jgi:hypothetical protein
MAGQVMERNIGQEKDSPWVSRPTVPQWNPEEGVLDSTLMNS